jgi:DNA-binding transcriptional LysR family regulator
MKQEIEFRHLRYFLAVAEILHFSKAAAQLGMAQPPLSQQIRNLERIVGYPLFQRTTRGVKLTKVGQYFRERARNAVTQMQDDVEMARRLGSGQEGILTVGFSGSVMLTTLPKAIERYRRVYPKVELRLRELVTAEQMPSLLDGTLDLASCATANRGRGFGLNRCCESDSLRYFRFVTDLRTRPQFVPEIFETNRLYFSRGGWGPSLSIGLSHVVKQKGSGQRLCRRRHSGQL